MMITGCMTTHCAQKEILNLKKDKCYFRFLSVPLFGEIISRHGVRSDPRKLKAWTEMPLQYKKAIAGILLNN